MYTNSCNYCGTRFSTDNYNKVFCSGHCADNYRTAMQNKNTPTTRTHTQHDHNITPAPGISIEAVIAIAVGGIAWESMKNWDEFEPVTSHILLAFNYLFYKPLHFTTNIYDYFTSIEQDYGHWISVVKWGGSIFYVLFVFSFYLAIISMLNEKKLTWVWVLFLVSPLITHGVWYFFISK
ncbi:hypothetical protein [Acinetobacter pittii]|uniref:hypothetical protein n=1 Tax=Acinetobacter pittii TaxID=48296 RepID=UPI001ABF2FAB|nr:hypothetical protein [Acinetobacter pittii]QDB82212.1 hypothetical protein APMS7_07400 [Acinetobacter pittii]